MAKKKNNYTKDLKSLHLKATPARITVLQFLQSSDKPVDTSQIIDYLNRKKVETDPATVFRILGVFTHKGLVKQIQFNEGKFRYEMADRGDHHHFVCENCGEIQDISGCTIDKLEKDLQKKKGLLVKHHSLEFFGLCADCQQ